MYFNPLLFLFPAWVAAQTTTITSCQTALLSIQLPFLSTAVDTVTTTAQVYFVTVTTPVATVTIPQSTLTTTSTVITTATVTAAPNTDVFFTTSTAIATTTTIITTTRTSTVLVWVQTTSTTTTTIPPPIGFLPVADTTASAYPAPRAARLRRRALAAPGGTELALEAALEAADADAVEKRQLSISLSPVGLPVGIGVGLLNGGYVQCTETVVIRFTNTMVATNMAATATVTPLPTGTAVFETLTATATAIFANVATTSAFVTTATVTETFVAEAVTTTTMTSTAIATATATFYQACASNNLLGPIVAANGGTIYNVFNNGPGIVSTFNLTRANSAYDCCVACQSAFGCTGSAFGVNNGNCILLRKQDNSCPAQGNSPAFYREQVGRTGGYVISNGACGYLYDGGLG